MTQALQAEQIDRVSRAKRTRLWLGVGALALLVMGGALTWIILAASPSSAQDRAAQAGLSYARNQMVWNSGPTLQSTHVTTLRSLRSVLAHTVPPNVQQDVNAGDLMRRFGPNRRVALVIVTGVFNSLPPDEGIITHGDVVAVVDMKTDNVLLLMD